MKHRSGTNSWQLYLRLQTYAFRHKQLFVLSILGFLVFALAQGAFLFVLEYLIGSLEGKEIPEAFQYVPSSWVDTDFFVPIAVIVLSIFFAVGGFVGNFYIASLGLRAVNNLRKDVFSHMVYLPQAYYDKKNSGELLSLIVYNIEQVTASVTNATKIVFRDGFTLLTMLGVLIYHSWKLTLLFIIITPLLATLVWLAGRYFRKKSELIQLTVGKISHILKEAFQGIKLVKSYGSEQYERERFNKAADDSLTHRIKFERVLALQAPVLHVIISCTLAVVILLIILFWEGDSAAAVVYVTTAGAITKPFRQVSTLNSVIQKGLAAAETIFNVIDLLPEENSCTQKLEKPVGQIEFRNVSFSYNGENPAVSGISFRIDPGETVALVGSSGSGKSTIANLLLRFYSCDSGEILLDGIGIDQLDVKNLRSNIALVNQQTVLFNDSVSVNIAYGSEKADIEKIMSAARLANAEEFIQGLDKQYETSVREDGSLLSGGQRQRIAIARALYKDAPVLVLDEATSALDNDSEKQIQMALDNLKQGRSTLVIAHRLSTIENADLILVMSEGKIIERGTHSFLMESSGYYASLYKSSRVKG